MKIKEYLLNLLVILVYWFRGIVIKYDDTRSINNDAKINEINKVFSSHYITFVNNINNIMLKYRDKILSINPVVVNGIIDRHATFDALGKLKEFQDEIIITIKEFHYSMNDTLEPIFWTNNDTYTDSVMCIYITIRTQAHKYFMVSINNYLDEIEDIFSKNGNPEEWN